VLDHLAGNDHFSRLQPERRHGLGRLCVDGVGLEAALDGPPHAFCLEVEADQ
jgi:hypothetical protein